MDARRYRRIVEEQGLSTTHRQVITWVPRDARVLELGCASGYLGGVLIREKGCQVVGVEVDPTAAAEARVAGLNVIEGSIEDVGLRESIGERFDVVIAADVLEHLANPDVVLKHFIRWLNPNGKAIVAVPNIATWSIRRQLFLHGDFSYQDSGILDRTHLHHFTWNTFHSLLREQNWRIEATMAGGLEMPILQRPLIGWPERIHAWLERGPAVEQGSLGGIQLGLRRAARGYVSLAASLSDEIGRLWPNLCVSHLALLLAPPKGGS